MSKWQVSQSLSEFEIEIMKMKKQIKKSLELDSTKSIGLNRS